MVAVISSHSAKGVVGDREGDQGWVCWDLQSTTAYAWRLKETEWAPLRTLLLPGVSSASLKALSCSARSGSGGSCSRGCRECVGWGAGGRGVYEESGDLPAIVRSHRRHWHWHHVNVDAHDDVLLSAKDARRRLKAMNHDGLHDGVGGGGSVRGRGDEKRGKASPPYYLLPLPTLYGGGGDTTNNPHHSVLKEASYWAVSFCSARPIKLLGAAQGFNLRLLDVFKCDRANRSPCTHPSITHSLRRSFSRRQDCQLW